LLHLMHAAGERPPTFTLGFEDWAKSEHEAARSMADAFETDHHEISVGRDLIETTVRTAECYDEPLGGTSFLPTFRLAEYSAAKRKVVFAGDGGDEVFTGYDRYHAVHNDPGREDSMAYTIRQYHAMMSWSGYSYNDLGRVLAPEWARPNLDREDEWFYREIARPGLSPVKAFQWLDLHSFLPEVILTKVDRASMAHALEVRVPYLDHELVETLFGLDESVYYESGIQKPLLRRLGASALPPDILARPKRGFGAPVKARHNLEPMARTLRNGRLAEDGLIRPAFIEEAVRARNRKSLWPLFVLEMWHRRWA
ncbi:MAG: asparagine synthase C-terminal domain-containing protein, partial [Verrucomicrobiota bacterium]